MSETLLERLHEAGQPIPVDAHLEWGWLQALCLEAELELTQAQAECFKLAANSCVHDLVGDPHGHFECSKVIELKDELLKARSALALAAEDGMGREELLLNAQKDAARYRWLRNEYGVGIYNDATSKLISHYREHADAAIDAALKEQQ